MAILPGNVDLGQWCLGPSRAAGPVSIMPILTENGQPPLLQLIPKAEIETCTVPFTPSVYHGNGDESRKSVIYTIPEKTAADLKRIEAWAEASIKEILPNAQWSSSLRVFDKFPPGLRAKICTTGCVQVVGVDGLPCELPTDWAGLSCVPIIQVRGVFVQKHTYGLILETVGLMLGAKKTRALPQFSFA